MPYQLQVPPVAAGELLLAMEDGVDEAIDEAIDEGIDDELGAMLDLLELLPTVPLKCVASFEVALMPLVLLIR